MEPIHGNSWIDQLPSPAFGTPNGTGGIMSCRSTVRLGYQAVRVNLLRDSLSRKLRELGVEERAWADRNDGFASLHFNGKEFAHFHHESEIDIRLGKDAIRRERLVRAPRSGVHPDRSANSPWFEVALGSTADVDEVIRLVKIAILGLKGKK